MKKQKRPAPVRVMDGARLAAVVTSESGQITIRPEPGYTLTEASITVVMKRDRPPRKKATP